MKRTTWMACALIGGLLFVACGKKEDKASDSKPAATAPAGTAPGAKPVALSDDDVPVPEDFIDEATKEIPDTDGAKSELDKLEKEIAAGR